MPQIEKDFIVTIGQENKNGIKIRADYYLIIKDLLLSALVENEVLSINTLVSILHEKLVDQFKDDTGWYIYHIKLDLEARSLIIHNRSENKVCINKSVKERNRAYGKSTI